MSTVIPQAYTVTLAIPCASGEAHYLTCIVHSNSVGEAIEDAQLSTQGRYRPYVEDPKSFKCVNVFKGVHDDLSRL